MAGERFPWGRLLAEGVNIKMTPLFLQTGSSRKKLTAMLRNYFELGGMHVQINAVANQTLRDAQKHPDRYPDLVVRVSGYSAHFVDLGRATQDDGMKSSRAPSLVCF